MRVYRHLAGDTAEALVEDAQRWREQGFTALRYGPLAAFDEQGLAQWDPQRRSCETIAATEALRDALGDEVDLLLDAHTMFSPAEAAYLGHALEPYRLFFYEDPIRPLNPQSLRLVRDKVNLPLATGEQLAHKWEFQPLIENELVDYLRVDLVHAGGITEAKKILAMGEAHGQRSALHHASSPVNGVACLHVDMAVPNFGIQEWMELEPLYELFPNAPRAEAGYVVPPDGPGPRARARRGRGAASAPRATRRCPRATGRTAASRTTEARCPASAGCRGSRRVAERVASFGSHRDDSTRLEGVQTACETSKSGSSLEGS